MRLPRPDLRPLRHLRPRPRPGAHPGAHPRPQLSRWSSRTQFVWIWMGDPAKADRRRSCRGRTTTTRRTGRTSTTMYPIKATAMLMVDNLMDLTHLGYVHTSTIGGNPSQHVEAKMQTERTPLGLKFTRWMLNSVPPPTYVKAVGFKGRIDRCQRVRVHRARLDPAMDRRGRGGRRRDGDTSGRPLVAPPVPRPDAGDRHDVLLFLVGANGFRQDDPAATEQFYQERPPRSSRTSPSSPRSSAPSIITRPCPTSTSRPTARACTPAACSAAPGRRAADNWPSARRPHKRPWAISPARNHSCTAGKRCSRTRRCRTCPTRSS